MWYLGTGFMEPLWLRETEFSFHDDSSRDGGRGGGGGATAIEGQVYRPGVRPPFIGRIANF